ncbi:25c66e89-7f99-4b46-8740-0ca6dee52507 [Thermothielavioides terrestris]|uniref:Vacuolar ATPase assembly protein VMA22 n=1 Tax=Thermothielavioides terrestris TaxID=2587410 RepID=A0A446BU54_9PEZI|nr:25c66e89-7f99-4b46-8740-0ca6dee52507 [Thermothielavioides terrestris]
MPTDTSSYESIDSLLAHYLDLLDEYTRLRDALHTLQADMFQHLARANFSAERGVRYYGQDYYDERMQATRRVQIRLRGEGGDVAGKEGSRTGSGSGSGIEEGGPLFTVKLHLAPGQEQQEKQEQQADSTAAERPADRPAAKRNDPASTDASRDASNPDHPSPGETPAASSPNNNSSSNNNSNSNDNTNNSSSSKPNRKSDDPLRWFGILTPPALRQAQAQAIRAVEALVPRLATVSAEMAGVEIAVRRARKRRARRAARPKTLQANAVRWILSN